MSVQVQNGTRIANVEDLAAAISAPKANRLHLRESPLWTQFQPQPGNAFLVWRTATAGCTVHGGTIDLPERGVLLLAGHGTHFHGTTFRGGVIMCAGAQYSGTFQNCTFISAALYAVHGAAITLRRCTTFRAHLALTLSADATHATLSDCTFRKCTTTIIVDGGAMARAQDCGLLHTSFAVVVTGRRSHAALERCAARGGTADTFGTTGVTVHLGSVTLRDCLLDNFYSSMHGEGGTAEAHGVAFVNSVHCITMTSRARGLVRECDLSLTRPGRADPIAVALTSIAGSRGRACMQMEGTAVHHAISKARALGIDDGSAVAAKLCRFDCSSDCVTVGLNGGGGRAVLSHCAGTTPEHGVMVSTPAGRVRVEGGSFEGGAIACGAIYGAQLTATDCDFRSRSVPEWAGVVTVDRAQASLRRCRIRDGVMGVFAAGSRVTVTDTTVSDVRVLMPNTSDRGTDFKGGCGLTCVGGQLTVRGGHVERCAIGLEAYSEDGNTSLVTLEDVGFDDCAYGAACDSPSAAKVLRCTFRGLKGAAQQAAPELAALRHAGLQLYRQKGDMGISLQCMNADVEDCTFEGYTTAIQVHDGSYEAAVRRCVVRATSARGLGLLAFGKVAVEDCEFHGLQDLQTYGIVATRAGSAAVRRCTFESTSLSAVQAEGTSSVTVVDSTVAGVCDSALMLRDTARLSVQDCRVDGAQTAAHIDATGGKFNAKRVTFKAVRANVLIQAVPAAGVTRSTVKLVDSMLTHAATGVSVVEGAADVAILRCQISSPDTGVFLSGPVTARIKGGMIFDCMSGVYVGRGAEGQHAPCTVCERAGQAAMHAVVQSGLAAGADGGDARCTHEGALAKLSMADCEVSTCMVAGVRVNLHGRFEGDGVTARACDTGYHVEFNRVRSSFAGCRAIECQISARGLHRTSAVVDVEQMDVPIPEVEVVPGGEW